MGMPKGSFSSINNRESNKSIPPSHKDSLTTEDTFNQVHNLRGPLIGGFGSNLSTMRNAQMNPAMVN